MSPITPIGGDRPVIGTIGSAKPDAAKGQNPFTQLLESADSEQKAADNMLARMVSGEQVEPHDVMLSLRKAEARFQLVMQVRNKVIDAYQTIMKEQI